MDERLVVEINEGLKRKLKIKAATDKITIREIIEPMVVNLFKFDDIKKYKKEK